MKMTCRTVAVGVLLALAGCGEKTQSIEAPAKPVVAGATVTFVAGSPQLASLAVVKVAEMTSTGVELTGRLVWDENRTVRIYSPFAGRVVRIVAQPGERVAAGQALAYISSPDFGQAQADAGKAVADYALAEKNFARVNELYENGVAPRKELAISEAEHARARSELSRAQARVRLYGGSGGVDQSLALRSPIAGTVVERNLNPGQEVRADQGGNAALFVVTDPGRLWVQIDARESDLQQLRRGAAFKLRVPHYPDTAFNATLDVVADFIDPQSRVIRARGSVTNDDRRLKAEMLVTALFPSQGPPGVGVPSRAVVFSEGKHYAFVERRPGSFERVLVATGDERAGLLVVTSGLATGQLVVSEGALFRCQFPAPGPACLPRHR